jgi:ion channel-forming bestrophin family protein
MTRVGGGRGSLVAVAATAACLLLLAGETRAYVAVFPTLSIGAAATTRAAPAPATRLHSEQIRKPKRPIKDISYGEESRKYRRTVYSHDDWRVHRDPDRFVYYLAAIFKSGVYKNLGREVSATTAIATLVCLYNAVAGGWTDFAGAQHAGLNSLVSWIPVLGLPLSAFTISSSSLGLLLGTSSEME